MDAPTARAPLTSRTGVGAGMPTVQWPSAARAKSAG